MANLTRIQDMAKKLNLMNLASNVIALQGEDKDNLNFLEKILAMEVDLKSDKRKSLRKGRSHLPQEKNLETYDLSFQSGITKWHLDKIQNINWIDDKRNLVIIGGAGTGKTHLATAIGYIGLKNEKTVFYCTVKELIYFIRTATIIKKSKIRLGYLKNCDLVIIDELGYTNLNTEESLMVYEQINNLNKHTSLVIISNKKFDAWNKVFNDEAIATTIIDRLIENCQVINLIGGSYRLAKHKDLFLD